MDTIDEVGRGGSTCTGEERAPASLLVGGGEAADGLRPRREMFRLVGGASYPPTEDELRARVERAVRRSYRPDGFGRQLIAIQTAPSRVLKLRGIRAPTLVLHGSHDP